MSTDLKPMSCEYCGNFHDPAYSDCATGEPIAVNARLPVVSSGEWVAALREASRALRTLRKTTDPHDEPMMILVCDRAMDFIEMRLRHAESAATESNSLARGSQLI